MNKFSLEFRDSQIESEYQNSLCNSQRKLTFNLASLAFAFNYGLRVILCFTEDDYTLFTFKLCLFMFIATQFLIVRSKPKYIRLAFVLINLTNLTINFQTDSNTNLAIQNLKGANSMATGFLVLLSGEFPEAVLIFTIQTVQRIVIVFVLGDVLNLGTLTTTIFLNFFCYFYFYQYHQARRSQYLLSRVNSDWDKVLTDLIHLPYILLKFNYDELNYKIIKHNRFPFHSNDQQVETDIVQDDSNLLNFKCIKGFLHDSIYNKHSLSSLLFKQIKSYQSKPLNFYKNKIQVIFKRQLVEMNISIFYSSDPLILLQFKLKETNEKEKIQQFYFLKFYSLNNVFINFINALNRRYKLKPLAIIQRKMIRVKLLHTLKNFSHDIKKVKITKALRVMKYLFPELQIIYNTNINVQIETIKNIFYLLFFQIFENSTNQMVHCQILVSQESLSLQFDGKFNVKKLNNFIKLLHYQINQLLEIYEIGTNRIFIYFRKEPLLSFYLPEPQQRFYSNQPVDQGQINSLTDEQHFPNLIY